MANWRQIQGRIRRARTSADPAGKLNELFQKTRDAMVAFEAGTVEEKAGRSDAAIRWYTIAAQRFRRADWRQKAAEALTRLGASVPEETVSAAGDSQSGADNGNGDSGTSVTAETQSNIESEDAGEAAVGEIVSEAATAGDPSAPVAARPAGERTRRRRGRRGGRRHRRGGAADASAKAGAPHAHAAMHHEQPHTRSVAAGKEETSSAESIPASEAIAAAAARFVPEPTGALVERATYIRAGDPALASRFAQLESLLRRLISAPLHRMDDLEDAPAGPGVFLLSDSDLMTNYYIESCKTLRIGTSQLARAGRAGRGARTEGKTSLRSQLAEHLEINDTQVSDYLRKHCVVRWLQLDEDAAHVAHFAIALLRPALNAE
jgi:hypothetical protein